MQCLFVCLSVCLFVCLLVCFIVCFINDFIIISPRDFLQYMKKGRVYIINIVFSCFVIHCKQEIVFWSTWRRCNVICKLKWKHPEQYTCMLLCFSHVLYSLSSSNTLLMEAKFVSCKCSLLLDGKMLPTTVETRWPGVTNIITRRILLSFVEIMACNTTLIVRGNSGLKLSKMSVV